MTSASVSTGRLLRCAVATVKTPDTVKTLSSPLSSKNVEHHAEGKKTLSPAQLHSLQHHLPRKRLSSDEADDDNPKTTSHRRLRLPLFTTPLTSQTPVGRTLPSFPIGTTSSYTPIYQFRRNERSIHTSIRSTVIFKSREKADIPKGKTFFDHIFDDISDCADKPAIIGDLGGTTYTYSQTKEYSMKLGLALLFRGYRKGDVVAIMAPNVVEYALTVFGCAYVGITVALLNPLESSSNILRQISATNAKALFVFPLFKDKVAEIMKESETVRDVFVFGFPFVPKLTKLVRPLFFRGIESITFAALLKSADAEMTDNLHRDARPDPDMDVLVLPFSSGTTGLPKGVIHTHATTIAYIEVMIQTRYFQEIHREKMDSDLRMMLVLPMFHIFGYAQLCSVLKLRGTAVMKIMKPPFNDKIFFKCVQKKSINYIPVVPNIIDILANSENLENFNLSSLRLFFSAAAPLNIKTAELLMSRIPNLEIRQGLGMTEGVVASTFEEGLPLASVGRLCANTTAKTIHLETMKELGYNEVGEIVVQTPAMMTGYWNNPDANADSFLVDEEGRKWLRTGDVGYFDENEVIHIVDRIKEMIKYKGNQVSPVEIELQIRSLEGVRDAAVVGIPDQKAGEIPLAFVVKSEGATLTGEEIQSHIRDSMNSHDQLRGGVVFIDENPGIPRSAAGKILRRELKQRLPTDQS